MTQFSKESSTAGKGGREEQDDQQQNGWNQWWWYIWRTRLGQIIKKKIYLYGHQESKTAWWHIIKFNNYTDTKQQIIQLSNNLNSRKFFFWGGGIKQAKIQQIRQLCSWKGEKPTSMFLLSNSGIMFSETEASSSIKINNIPVE